MEYLNNYACGAVSGTIGCLVSHPFFTLKTELQNGKKLSEIKNQMKRQTFSANKSYLYSGLARMCIGLSFEKMLVFGTYNSLFRYYDLDRNNFWHSMSIGFLSGLSGAFASTVAEQLAIDRINNAPKNYSLGHLYKGLLPTIGRESVGFSIYFVSYDQFSKRYNPEKSMLKTAIGGACSITCALIFFYPLDKIKTNIQSGQPVSFVGVYKGAHLGFPRALIFHTTCFVVFEYMSKVLH